MFVKPLMRKKYKTIILLLLFRQRFKHWKKPLKTYMVSAIGNKNSISCRRFGCTVTGSNATSTEWSISPPKRPVQVPS